MTVTTAEHAVLASGDGYVRRYLSVGTRESVFADQITSIDTDSDSHGIIALNHTTSSEGAGLQPGQTVDIGTTPGARDVGIVRLRYTNGTDTSVTIAETAPADLPVQVGHYLTIRNEYLPFDIPKRVTFTRDGDGNITAVNEYLDYDEVYPGGSHPYPPKANITAGHKVDGLPLEVQRAGWVDGYRTASPQTYRTIDVSSEFSVPHNPGEAIDFIAWTFTGSGSMLGSVNDPAVTLRLDVGFHQIVLFIADASGRHNVMQIGVWVHDDSYLPLTDFAVTSDETELGREMQVEFFGDPNSADATVLPKRSLVCYWEEVTFRDGDTPESYRGQCVGWVFQDQPILKLRDSRYGMTFGATVSWKQRLHANSTALLDTGSTPTTYSEVSNLTIDRALDWSLRAVDTLRTLVNVFYSGIPTEVEAATLPGDNAWTQLSQIAPRAYLAQILVDSTGALYVTRPYSYLSAGERLTVPDAMSVTVADWWDQDGLTLPTIQVVVTGVVTAAAELWDSGSRVEYASQAPGLRSGAGVAYVAMPGQFVSAPTPQGDLNRLCGLFYFHENNPRPTVTLILAGNLDVVEPAYAQPVRITWSDDTVSGTVLDNTPFILKRVSVQHNNDVDGSSAPPKIVSWTLEQATDGASADTAPVQQMDGVTQIDDTDCGVTAAFSSSPTICDVTFTDESTGDLLWAWAWDFGDGSPLFVAQNPVHHYAAPGTYTVTLRVASLCGDTSTVSHSVTIDVETMTPDFTFTASGLTVTFTDTSTADSGVVGWLWDFGDDTTSTAQNPVHTYAALGHYTATLTILTACGSEDSVDHDLPFWCHFFDFLSDDQGFTNRGDAANDWTGAVGWQSPTGASAVSIYTTNDIHLVYAKAVVSIDCPPGTTPAPANVTLFTFTSADPALSMHETHIVSPGCGTHVNVEHNFDGTLVHGVESRVIKSDESDPSVRHCTNVSLLLIGIDDTPPFGDDNCPS